MQHHPRIESDPSRCGGDPCIAGTRVMVWVVLEALADGMEPAQVAEEYPPLTVDDVHAALAYAADTLKQGGTEPDSR